MTFGHWYDRNYKKLLIIPAIVFVLALSFLVLFYYQNGDIINKDISLSGGATITLFTDKSADGLSSLLDGKINNYELKTFTDNTGEQTMLSIKVDDVNVDSTISICEEFLGEKLNEENSSIETTSASLSKDFYNQLIISILLAFFWMAAVVFLIFAKGKGVKFKVILLNVLFGFFMGMFFMKKGTLISVVGFLIFAVYIIYTYIKYSVPAFAVMLCAFADIMMTLAVVDLTGMKISTGGIIAFLMLIGYSVDTDVLLTSRVTKNKGSPNEEIWSSFKTGTTMTMTSIVAIAAALFIVYPYGTVLNEIFIILLIGLGFDILNTWASNASIIKWYTTKRK